MYGCNEREKNKKQHTRTHYRDTYLSKKPMSSAEHRVNVGWYTHSDFNTIPPDTRDTKDLIEQLYVEVDRIVV